MTLLHNLFFFKSQTILNAKNSSEFFLLSSESPYDQKIEIKMILFSVEKIKIIVQSSINISCFDNSTRKLRISFVLTVVFIISQFHYKRKR
jgi:hypothetical protein